MPQICANPYRPGAGHSPPHLAGREKELQRFAGFLKQETVVDNLVLTGLRGVGKTVLMEDEYKPRAQNEGWVWVGSDFSEACFLSEQNLCIRLLTDLSVFTQTLSVTPKGGFGFGSPRPKELSFQFLANFMNNQPGLPVDKLKATLELVWAAAQQKPVRGIVFAYDEAQLVQDRAEREEYPLALLLECFQSIQRRGARYLLLLTGLPTLFPKLVESRTYAERMFSIQELGRLPTAASREAILEPLKNHPWRFSDDAVRTIVKHSGGYPYFIQFICREAFDYFRVNPNATTIPIDPIVRKLDADFFAGRWENLPNRQRDLLYCASQLENADEEFTISEVVEASKALAGKIKPFSAADVSQVLPRLIDKGLVYKNRHGKYAFAVPLFSGFIRRKYESLSYQQRLFD